MYFIVKTFNYSLNNGIYIPDKNSFQFEIYCSEQGFIFKDISL